GGGGAGASPVGSAACDLAHHDPRHVHATGFRVLRVRAVVPLLRCGHGHHLPGVRGIGEHLLVPRHRRVEDRLAEPLPGRPEPGSAEGAAVLEHQDRRGPSVHPAASPSATTSPPRSSVCTTRPRSLRPRKAEFRLLEANGGSTAHSADGSKTTRLAGRPGSIGPPWSPAPRIRAGMVDRASIARESVSSPGSTTWVRTAANAVSSPIVPNDA